MDTRHLIIFVSLVGCGSEPFPGWGFAESDRPGPSRTDAISTALMANDWHWSQLSDHSNEDTDFSFARDGILSVDWSYSDLFLDEQPEPRQDLPGEWSLDERGDVTMRWALEEDGSKTQITRTFVLLDPVLSAAFLQTPIETPRWVSRGFLVQDEELTRYHNFTVHEWESSTGRTVSEGNVEVNLSFSRPVVELDDENCAMSIEFVGRGTEPWSATIDTPCEVIVDADLVSLQISDDDDDWERTLTLNGIEREDERWDRLSSFEETVHFDRRRPGVLIAPTVWDAFLPLEE